MNLFVSIFKGEYTKEKFTIGLSKTTRDMPSAVSIFKINFLK